jgi:hypothetical protein
MLVAARWLRWFTMIHLPPRYQGAAGLARYWYLSHVPQHKGWVGKELRLRVISRRNCQ